MDPGAPNFGPLSGDMAERDMNSPNQSGPWYRGMTGYHWWVLIVASLGWLFDTMDQRIFVLARGPALVDLLPPGTPASQVTWYGGVATAVTW